jgi:hypothetical protein
VKFNPQDIENFENMTAQAREIVCVLPAYIQQLAESRDRLWGFEDLALAKAGEQILGSWLHVTITRLVWTVLLDHPLQAEIHPAITLVREPGGRVVDVLIEEDLRSWLPEYPVDPGIRLVMPNSGGDELEQGVPIGA